MKRLEDKNNKPTNKIGRFFKRMLYVLLILVIGFFVIFYFYRDSPYFTSVKKFIGLSPTIVADSLRVPEITDDSIGDSEISSDFFKFKTNYDSLPGQAVLSDSSASIQELSPDSIVVEADSLIITQEKSSDTISEIKPLEISVPSLATTEFSPKSSTIESVQSYDSSYDLFDELLIGETTSNTDLRTSINTEKDILSRKSTLKILAVCAKSILLNINNEASEEILFALAGSESISSLHISNRSGQVIFTTDKKNMNKSIVKIFPEISLESPNLICTTRNSTNLCTLPIFHTYGQVGNAVIVYSKN